MSGFVKQSTDVIIKAGFFDATDAVTAEEGLTISQADIQISKNGAAFAQTSEGSPATTHDADGYYPIPLTATDTGTLGRIQVKVYEAGALRWEWEAMVVPANAYDSLVLGTDYLQVDVEECTGDGDSALGLANAGTAFYADAQFEADVIAIHGTDLTETSAGYLAAALVKLLDVEVPASTLNDLSTVTTAQVNAEMVDVMATDTHAELGQGTPPATATYAQMFGYLYKGWRNLKVAGGGTYELYNDAGDTVDQKATISDDDTDFTFTEFVTGP